MQARVVHEKISTINPATGQIIHSYKPTDTDEIPSIVNDARTAFAKWKKKDVLERCDYIRSLAKELNKNKDKYAMIITQEMGKPIAQSYAEIEKCVWLCEYYCENAESFLQDQIVPTEFRKSFVSFEPLGVVAGIMPWNFPFWQVMRFVVPTMIAGNVAILKHSSVCIGSSLDIKDSFAEAGFPDNVFQIVIGNYRAGEALVQSKIDAISVTGSVITGQRVAELAAKCLKKVVLELGGSDPFIVLEDADLDHTVPQATHSRLLNTGQSCIAAKRFIVVKKIANKFADLFVQSVKDEVVGDPMEKKTTVGPLVRDSQRQAIIKQVDDARVKNAEILLGGNIIDGGGFYYEPTIISKVNHGMQILTEEVFGPVAPIIIVENEAEAIKEANNSEFGLGARIWTSSSEKGLMLAREIQCGVVKINEMVRSDPRLPFGGVKNSGIGRELSEFGIREFVNVKSIAAKDITTKLVVE